MQADATTREAADAPLAADVLRRLQRRSDGRGLLRLAGHLGLIAATGWLYGAALARSAPLVVVAPAAVLFGFTLVTMFAAMHESIHRTAFRSRRLGTRSAGSPACCLSTTRPSIATTTAGITASRRSAAAIRSSTIPSPPICASTCWSSSAGTGGPASSRRTWRSRAGASPATGSSTRRRGRTSCAPCGSSSWSTPPRSLCRSRSGGRCSSRTGCCRSRSSPRDT